MTIAIGGSLSYRTLRQKMKSTGSGNIVIKTTKLKGAMTNSDVVALLTAQSALSNAGIVAATIDGYPVTGYPVASNTLQNLVSAVVELAFTRDNPVNTAKKMTRNFLIPAYKDFVMNDAGQLDTTNTDLLALIALLEDNLAFEGADGTWYAGSFTFDNSKSGFATVNMREIA